MLRHRTWPATRWASPVWFGVRLGLRPQVGRKTSQVYCDGRGWWSQPCLPDRLVLGVKQHEVMARCSDRGPLEWGHLLSRGCLSTGQARSSDRGSLEWGAACCPRGHLSTGQKQWWGPQEWGPPLHRPDAVVGPSVVGAASPQFPFPQCPVCACALLLSHSVMSNSLWPCTIAHQAPLFMGFSRQDC